MKSILISCNKLTKDSIKILKGEINNLKTYVGDKQLPAMVSSLVGYMGYDMVRLFEKLPKQKKDNINIPYAIFMRPATVAIFDNLKNTITLATIVLRQNQKLNTEQISKIYKKAEKKLFSIKKKLGCTFC